MREGEPSRTALGAAIQRAAHQIEDGGRIFFDPLAVPILGMEPDEIRRELDDDPPQLRVRFRVSIAARSRFAENRLGFAVEERQVTQYVILGAGLDTFAYRNPYGASLRVFEVDYPSTQAWKRERLAAASIAIPSSLTLAPVDFESDGLLDALVQVGFDPNQRSLVGWLGCVSYLERGTVFATLKIVADLPGGCDIVMDFSEPAEVLEAQARQAFERRAALVAAHGEPWLSAFVADEIVDHLRGLGFTSVLALGSRQIAQRFFPSLPQSGNNRGSHFLHAWKD